ncbi:hypothetical protein [Acidaminobacter hydrogenoformans]|uniref:Uncharacterized protein n=1 Tax=Acidaminobacter hydrogenoformans DSM 2784 TaxID=1120920 RepID=A0A1G5S137_9FIRM|nr:hypothetical protein [Acidaminobacter hydrogenoformans]SCZ79451.1 hypothetical protein SAMN03080599_01762 [Acidaminobacter hydrogenoformans DSM 2784]
MSLPRGVDSDNDVISKILLVQISQISYAAINMQNAKKDTKNIGKMSEW